MSHTYNSRKYLSVSNSYIQWIQRKWKSLLLILTSILGWVTVWFICLFCKKSIQIRKQRCNSFFSTSIHRLRESNYRVDSFLPFLRRRLTFRTTLIIKIYIVYQMVLSIAHAHLILLKTHTYVSIKVTDETCKMSKQQKI